MLPTRLLLPCLLCLFAVLVARLMASPETTGSRRAVLDDHEKRLRPLDVAAGEAWWQASTTGSKEAFERKVVTQNKIDEALSDPKAFAASRCCATAGRDRRPDRRPRPSTSSTCNTSKKSGCRPTCCAQMVEKSNAVEETFNRFRAHRRHRVHRQRGARTCSRSRTTQAAGTGVGRRQGGRRRREGPPRYGQAAQPGGGQLGFQNFHGLQHCLNEQDGKYSNCSTTSTS
ncbi:MAG: hypothetical protein U0736_13025 [Gemmataceae bacterium]